jgi:para-aminobenzoate synthetase component 1
MRFRVHCLDRHLGAPPASQVLAALPAHTPAVLLDDAVGLQMLAWDPDRRLHGSVKPGPRRGGRGDWAYAEGDVGQRLVQAFADEIWEHEAGLPHLGPGWCGWLGYECGHAYEAYPWHPPAADGWPDYHAARFRKALVWVEGEEALLLHAEAEGAPETEAETVVARREATELLATAASLKFEEMSLELSPRIGRARFEEQVRRLRGWIGEGELFQANLSHELAAAFRGDPRRLYAARRRNQPTTMASYWQDGRGRALLSQSPELFLAVQGQELTTRPIKGTAPRGGDEAADREQAVALAGDRKERAELTMIVDMARNDLGRVARTGSVVVDTPGDVEGFPTLFHRTAQVRARWDPRLGLDRLLAATFPPASITGAPKVRALEAIAELEQRRRGPYCGSLFHLIPGPQPQARFSVLIRTARVGDGELVLPVGAGIVWDSDPAREWEETLLKGRYLEGP